MPQMISGRGALISGIMVTKSDEAEHEGSDDLESGVEPPDSDYASHAPPGLFSADKRSTAADHASSNTDVDHSDEPVTRGGWQHANRAQVLGEQTSAIHSMDRAGSHLLALIAAIIAVSVVVAKKNKSDDFNAKTAWQNKQQTISDVVRSISDEKSLAISTSPQAQAYHWLVFEDNLWEDPEEVTREMVIQRYVLAVFYYATSGPTSMDGEQLVAGRRV